MNLVPFPFEHKLMACPSDGLKWPDVLEIYRNNEENLEHWKQYYQSQGYKSWEEWREKFFRRFGLRQLKWEMFELTSPFVVDYFRGANFRGWKKLTGEKYLTFGQMAMLKPIQRHPPLRNLIRNFPCDTTVIGIRYQGCIFIVEGMHRCASYSLALREGDEPSTKIKIVLGRKNKLFRPMFLGKRI